MKSSLTIGVVGTAKNTGKTTTLSHLLHGATEQNIRCAVTGIGYDGEEIDTVTMLPKPRLDVPVGTIMTTAEVCLKRSPVGYRIIERTGIPTALGELLMIEVTKAGLVVVAGPNKVASLAGVLESMKGQHDGIVLVDGSINRLMPMSVVDRIIFATGAARSVEIASLLEEMKAIELLFSMPKADHVSAERRVSLLSDNTVRCRLSFRSVMDREDVDIIRESMTDNVNRVYIPGLISKEALVYIDEAGIGNRSTVQLVVPSPLTLLLTDSTARISSLIQKLYEKEIRIACERKPEFIGVTVNPFYPRYERERYTGAYIDKDRLMHEMKKELTVPVYNVTEDVRNELLATCIQ
jgi:hypothetical protein